MKRKEPPAAGCPEWMVTYGDMMGLVLCFFVMIASMSELKSDDKFYRVAAALQAAFGSHSKAGETPIELNSLNALIQELQAANVPGTPHQEGEAEVEGLAGRFYKVTDVRDGIHIEIGGGITFERFSPLLKPRTVELVRRIADKIRGKNHVIQVTGHATREPLPPDGPFQDALDLSYTRARAVADELIRCGIRRERIRIVAAGSAAPVERDDYTEELRARNRRVEIVVTEALVEDYAGQPFSREHQESPGLSEPR